MSYYRTVENRPMGCRLDSLHDKVIKVIRDIITDELNAGATSEEVLGSIIQSIGLEVSQQTVLRTLAERKAEREASSL